jgi:alpha-N-arabinofuranosidase
MEMKKLLFVLLLCTAALSAGAQRTTVIRVYPDAGEHRISRHIYGHFAEHLGSCIYNGLWVGLDSDIPNTQGYRTDVLEALRALQIPNLRWPGGCFADEYHWMDGIGPYENRPTMVNNNWGGTIEDNSFGTHEFLNLCELLGCEPYISANVGSGTVEEMAKWVEYMTSDGDSPMANLRRANGREKAWNVRFIGVGNESWGCGGNMRPEYYADLYRRYATYARNYDDNRLYKIASGASDYDYNWTEVLMQQVGRRMNGLSLHYYTVTGWQGSKGSATDFDAESYYWTMGKALEIEEVLLRHMAIMDEYDPERRIGLMVDEWGTWWDVEPGTNPGHLHQLNTLRDAMVAAVTLNVFNRYPERIQMANIAQIVNVLQSMILTDADRMVLTPSYHVFDLYKIHQEAISLPLDIVVDKREIRGRQVGMVNASASRGADGTINITLANIDLDNTRGVEIDLAAFTPRTVQGRMITAANMTDHNTCDDPHRIEPEPFSGARIENGRLICQMPAKSIVSLQIR